MTIIISSCANQSAKISEVQIEPERNDYSVEIFKDFDEVLLSGIGKISTSKTELPYIELYFDDDKLKYFKAFHTNGKIYKRFFNTRLNVLSTHHKSPLSRGFKSDNFTFYKENNVNVVFSYDNGNPYMNKEASLISIMIRERLNDTIIEKTYYPNENINEKPLTLNFKDLPINVNRIPDVLARITINENQRCYFQEDFSEGKKTFAFDEPSCFEIKISTFWDEIGSNSVDKYLDE